MKRNSIALMGLVGLMLTAFSGIAASQSVGIEVGVFYARPDPRLCPSPACGGYNLFEGWLPTADPCHGQLQFMHYVTGIYVRKADGTLTRINPSCDELLIGSIEPDPRFPPYDILVVRSIVSTPAENVVFGTLNASLDTGSLAGTTFEIIFSYDADEVTDSGDSYVQLNSFDFSLSGISFSRSDIFQGGQAIFHDGVLQNVTASFQESLPNAPVQNITFGSGDAMRIAYIDLDGQFGAGTLWVWSSDR